jgi:hypothetical protein
MKKQLIIVGIIVILLAVGLSGCNRETKTDSDLIVGTWKDSRFPNDSFTFLSNGAGSWAGDSILWDIKDGKLEITIQSSGTENIYNYTFSDNDQTLTLTYVDLSNINLILVKQ